MTQPINNPNRTRDHLANERTYLAWIRTSIALMGFGIVIVRLRYLMPGSLTDNGHGWGVGIAFGLAGILMVGIAHWNYVIVRRAIDTAAYQPAGRWIIATTVIVLLLGLFMLYHLLQAPVPSGPVGAF